MCLFRLNLGKNFNIRALQEAKTAILSQKFASLLMSKLMLAVNVKCAHCDASRETLLNGPYILSLLLT